MKIFSVLFIIFLCTFDSLNSVYAQNDLIQSDLQESNFLSESNFDPSFILKNNFDSSDEASCENIEGLRHFCHVGHCSFILPSITILSEPFSYSVQNFWSQFNFESISIPLPDKPPRPSFS